MKYLLSFVLSLALVSPAWGQIVPPAPKTPTPTKFKAVAPPSVKAGDHILIDASSAKGDVWFFYDELTFPKTRATQAGKILVLSTQINGKYTVDVASVGDNQKEKIVVAVTGGVDPGPGPKPPEPVPTDPLEALRVEMRAGFAGLTAGQASLVSRVTALEGKPVPPTPIPPDPGPTPTTSKLSLVVVWESADSTPAVSSVMNDLTFWRTLEVLGHKFFKLDKDQKDSKGNRIADVTGYAQYMDKAGLPTLIIMDQSTNKVLQAARLPSTKEEVRGLVKTITGK